MGGGDKWKRRRAASAKQRDGTPYVQRTEDVMDMGEPRVVWCCSKYLRRASGYDDGMEWETETGRERLKRRGGGQRKLRKFL